MNFTGKLNAKMASFAESMKNGADNCKLDGKIAQQQKKIRELLKEIGNLAVVRLEAGDEMSPEIMERYSAIKEAKEKISELEKERKISSAVCPSCGAKTSVGMKYCGKCGANMMEES
ncbi:MAG: zinc-ribbon domain-containing protein [Suilimivivens sp.]